MIKKANKIYGLTCRSSPFVPEDIDDHSIANKANKRYNHIYDRGNDGLKNKSADDNLL
jgi:hypothetical protein